MLRVIYGNQGMGKSRQMCAEANEMVEKASGTVVFIDKDEDHMYDLKRDIRFINAAEYRIAGKPMLYGFIAGIAARDFDLEAVFVNSFAKLIDSPVEELEELFVNLDTFSDFAGFDIVISINDGGASCPEFVKQYCF